MAVIPKKLTFKLYFRKKTKTQKITRREIKLRQLSKSSLGIYPQLFSYSINGPLQPPTLQPSRASSAPSGPCPAKAGRKREKIQGPKQGKKEIGSENPTKDKKYLNQTSKENIQDSFRNARYSKTKCSLMTKQLLFGKSGICFTQYATISAAYVETIKLDIAKILRKKGRVWSRICCDTPVSARPAETRMGKGKGSISYWVAKVEPGQLFFEFSGVTNAQLETIFQKLCKKTSVGLKIIS